MTHPEPGGSRFDDFAVPLAGAPETPPPSSLRGYASTLRRRWRWVVLGVVVGLLAGTTSALLAKTTTPTRYWRATNTLVTGSGGTSGTLGGGGTDLTQVAFLLRSAEVTNGVATALGVSPQVIDAQVSAIARSEVNAIDVTAVSTDPDQAVALADTAAQTLGQFGADETQRQYAAQRASLLQQIAGLDAQRAQLSAAVATDPTVQAQLDQVVTDYNAAVAQLQALTAQGAPASGFVSLQTATPIEINGGAYQLRVQANLDSRGGTAGSGNDGLSLDETAISRPTNISKPVRIAIGLGAGLVLGLVTAFVIEAWDDRLRRSERAEGVTGFSVLAEIPAIPRKDRKAAPVPAVDSPGGLLAERYRSLRTSVLFLLQHHAAAAAPTSGTPDAPDADAAPDAPRTPVILVSSPHAGEGKTTTVANLAAAFGDNGARTLVVDCDYRKPAIARFLQPMPDPEHLDEPARTRLDGVFFIPAPRLGSKPTPTPKGAPAPGILPTPVTKTGDVIATLRARVERWRDEFDVVLLDTPPLLMTNDAVDMLPTADSAVLVLRAGQTRVSHAERASNLLRRFDAEVLGVVLNGCSTSDTDGAYGYGYGYYTDDPARVPKGSKGSRGASRSKGSAPTPSADGAVGSSATRAPAGAPDPAPAAADPAGTAPTNGSQGPSAAGWAPPVAGSAPVGSNGAALPPPTVTPEGDAPTGPAAPSTAPD